MVSQKSRAVYENLDTSFVNLAELVRYLQRRDFVGWIHVELDEYDADIFLKGQTDPRVRETDHASGREGSGADALRRLLVRSTAPGGLVSIYEFEGEETGDRSSGAGPVKEDSSQPSSSKSAGKIDAYDPVALCAELIAAVERAVSSIDADFAVAFRAARLELAEDFSFLDPTTSSFEYSKGVVTLRLQPVPSSFMNGVGESLRRAVDKSASGYRSKMLRDRVAVELGVLARRKQTVFSQFKTGPLLDRIAGTRVL
jgi:hypothetical protein